MKGRVLCVDYGRSRAGLAVSDPLRTTAQPLEVVSRPKKGSLVQAIADIANDLEVAEIVVGLPLKLDGTSGPAAEAVKQFADALAARVGCPVKLWDERLSTAEASRRMRDAGVDARRQRGVVDKVAAAVILRSYLETSNDRPAIPEEAVLPEPVQENNNRTPRPGRSKGKLKPEPRRRNADWQDEIEEL